MERIDFQNRQRHVDYLVIHQVSYNVVLNKYKFIIVLYERR